jgi:hypothetical protein
MLKIYDTLGLEHHGSWIIRQGAIEARLKRSRSRTVAVGQCTRAPSGVGHLGSVLSHLEPSDQLFKYCVR